MFRSGQPAHLGVNLISTHYEASHAEFFSNLVLLTVAAKCLAFILIRNVPGSNKGLEIGYYD
jgi:hypothetical protein